MNQLEMFATYNTNAERRFTCLKDKYKNNGIYDNWNEPPHGVRNFTLWVSTKVKTEYNINDYRHCATVKLIDEKKPICPDNISIDVTPCKEFLEKEKEKTRELITDVKKMRENIDKQYCPDHLKDIRDCFEDLNSFACEDDEDVEILVGFMMAAGSSDTNKMVNACKNVQADSWLYSNKAAEQFREMQLFVHEHPDKRDQILDWNPRRNGEYTNLLDKIDTKIRDNKYQEQLIKKRIQRERRMKGIKDADDDEDDNDDDDDDDTAEAKINRAKSIANYLKNCNNIVVGTNNNNNNK
jgi:hypothetical protein